MAESRVIADASPRPELRGVWVDGFNDGFQTAAQCDLLVQRVRAAHMNAVFVQMRKRGDAFYYSNYEPWAAEDPSHFDALAYLCRIAHAPGEPRIQVHAWMNTCAVGGSRSVWTLPRLHPDWLSLSDTGSDYDGESTKIDPGNPAAADWTYRVCLDVVRHYDIDGIHLDFIRYGGNQKTVGHWGYNPVSVARFNQALHRTGSPAWNDPDWCSWRREQVTDLVRRVYMNAVALRPDIVVSAATICWGKGPADDAAYETHSASYSQVFAPWRDWLKEGILDLNVPMTYFSKGAHSPYWTEWLPFIENHQYDRLSTMDSAVYLNSISDSLDQIQSTRLPSPSGNVAAGVVLYSYASDDSVNGVLRHNDQALFDALPSVFPTDVPVPEMPWKVHPIYGGVMGVLFRDLRLTPADGESICLSGPKHVTIAEETDGNGFFSLTKVPAGTYFTRINDFSMQPGSPETEAVEIGPIVVRPGKVTIVTENPGGLFRTKIAGLGTLADGTEVTVAAGTVTVGSRILGDSFYVADDFLKYPVRVDDRGLVPATVPGDRVAVHGVVDHDRGMTVIHADAVRYLGAVMVP